MTILDTFHFSHLIPFGKRTEDAITAADYADRILQVYDNDQAKAVAEFVRTLPGRFGRDDLTAYYRPASGLTVAVMD